MFWSIFAGPGVPLGQWTARTLPWHWSLLWTYHKVCESVINDYTLRDLNNKPPPRSMWFDDEELAIWREHRKIERKENAQ